MDFVKTFVQGGQNQSQHPQLGTTQQGGVHAQSNQSSGGGGLLGGLGNEVNAAAGGGPASEKNEDYLDKAIDFVQEKVLGQGQQSNESAVEQATDAQIAKYIRGQYKRMTGSDMPIKERSHE